MKSRLLPGIAVLGVLLLVLSGCASAGSGDDGSQLATDDFSDASDLDEVAASSDADAAAAETPTVVEPAVTAAPSTSTPSTTTTTIATTVPLLTDHECAAEIPLEIRVGQLMFPLVTQKDLPAAAALAEKGMIGGVVLIGNPNAQIASDIAEIQNRSLLGPVIVAVDEEGGRVQRLAELTSELPSANTVAQERTLAEAKELARSHAVAIGELGFTMNLAPVVDLDNGGFIRSRSFGNDVDVVTDFSFATADGILEAGLTPVVKHFPGHGRGTDSHIGLPTLPNLDVLRSDDLIPFVRAVERGDLPIMIGHLVVPDLTNGKPATLSPEAIQGLLRDELGFDGLVMTDAFNMDAISATTNNADAAEQSIAAGVDLVMLGSLAVSEGTVAQVTEAVRTGGIDESSITESFLRVIETRGLSMCAMPEDIRPNLGCDTSSNCG